jgi:iron-sulfur cluster repair protein YtfE (RIC family)
MQEVVERVHALPDCRRDDVVLKLLDVISEEEEENIPEERIAYVEIADDLTDKEKAEMAAMRKEFEEHPENFTSLEDLMAECGITEEDLDKLPPVKLVYNL